MADGVLDATVLDLKVLQHTWTSVSEYVVGSGQDAGRFAIAESADEFRMRFVVAVVDAAGTAAFTAAVAAEIPGLMVRR